MSRKKVLVINPYLPTLGGGEKHMAYMCQFVERYYNYDVEIDILVHDYNDISIHDENYVTIDDVNKQFGLELRCTHIKSIEWVSEISRKERKKNRQNLMNYAKGYDLMINFKFQSLDIGKANCNLYGCMFPPKRLSKISPKWKWPYTMIRDRVFYKSYASFISNSAFTAHWVNTYWKPDPKNCVIYPPVFSKNEIKGRYDETKKKNIIISVGRFFVGSHCKKQLEMVRMFVANKEKFKDYEYHLVGAVSNDNRDQRYLKKIKKIANTVDNVFVHENYPFSKLMELYSQAKIFWHATGYGIDENIYPESMEHFGITTVEAMSYGAVPVVIRKGGQVETVVEGVNGFQWSTDEECIEKTLKLVNDDSLRKEMAEKSSERANDYSIETFYERNEELFHELHL